MIDLTTAQNTSLPSDWLSIDKGVSAKRLQLDKQSSIEVDASPQDMLWVTISEGAVQCNSPYDKTPKLLGLYDSCIFVWPRGPWKLIIKADQAAEVSVCRITLGALHQMLSVEFAGENNASNGMDLQQLARIVHFSPIRVRDLGRLFIHSHISRFRAISIRGIFFDLFAEMLDLLYGQDMAKCPFQVDSDTERKIRVARQIIVADLQNTPDFSLVAIEVDLPKQVLKEGFSFIYGKSMSVYLNDYRFEQARVMLESGKYLIKEIAFHIGYQNPSHFITSFKQRYGTTPKQWVKHLK